MENRRLYARLLALTLSLAMVFTGMGISVFAAGSDSGDASQAEVQAEAADAQQIVLETEEETASSEVMYAAAPSVTVTLGGTEASPTATLTWTAASGTTYDVRIWEGTGEYAGTAASEASGLTTGSYTTTAGQLKPAAAYSYQVQATDSEGSVWSTAQTFSTPAASSADAPSAPTGLSKSYTGAKSTKIVTTFSWNPSTGVNVLYTVRVWKSSAEYNAANEVINVSGISDTSYETKAGKIKTGTKYYYQVGAYVSGSKDATLVWSNVENFKITASVKKATNVEIKVPEQKLGGLKSDNRVTISWTKSSSDVAGYAIVRIKGSKRKVVVSDIDPDTGKYTFQADSGSYKYAVRAYHTQFSDVYKDSASVNPGTIIEYLDNVHRTFKWKVTVKRSSATLYSAGTGSTKIGTVKKGLTGIAVGKYPKTVKNWDKPSRVQVKFDNGVTGWVQWGTIKFKPLVTIKADYTLTDKLEFANRYDSSTSYLVWVNEYTQRCNVFKGKKGSWKLVRTFRCTTGNFYQPLSRGSKYKLGNKRGTVYRLDENGRSYYFKLARGFHGSGYFHTRCWWTDTGRPRNSVSSSGRPTTRGCIRMYNEDASYIWNLPNSSKVVIR